MNPLNRRNFIAACSAAGITSALLPGVLLALASNAAAETGSEAAPKITPEIVNAAATLAGITIAPDQMQQLLNGLNGQREDLQHIRAIPLPNSIAPAFIFDPLPANAKLDTDQKPIRLSAAPAIASSKTPKDLDSLAFSTVRELADLIRTRRVSSLDLTQMYLARLKRYDPQLHFVINLTEDRAIASARAADAEIAAGRYRGPLHGLPWGAKDLLAVKNYPTTWGAGGFEHQQFDYNATVVDRLDAAGAVLVAKLSMGALAMGDRWFAARTRTPWNTQQGSIAAPSTRCGVTGLRPTFGFVPRTGAMTLSWTMDKLGPICRSVEDCAIVLSTIHGPDGHDPTVRNAAFNWDADFNWRPLRIGYIEKDFRPPTKPAEDHNNNYARSVYDHNFDTAALEAIKKLGVNPVPITLPDLPAGAISSLLSVEAAAAFDDLTRSGRDRLLTEQSDGDWPNIFRTRRFYSAIDYIQANRARTLLMDAMSKIFQDVDVIVASTDGKQLNITNLTGHPAVIVPNGLRGTDSPPPLQRSNGDQIGGPGTPVSITFLGALYSDAQLAAFARAYQDATGFQKLHPTLA